MTASGWLTTFAVMSLASAAIGAILEYCAHAIRHKRKNHD